MYINELFSILHACGSSTQYNVLKGSLENVDKSKFEAVGGSHRAEDGIVCGGPQ